MTDLLMNFGETFLYAHEKSMLPATYFMRRCSKILNVEEPAASDPCIQANKDIDAAARLARDAVQDSTKEILPSTTSPGTGQNYNISRLSSINSDACLVEEPGNLQATVPYNLHHIWSKELEAADELAKRGFTDKLLTLLKEAGAEREGIADAKPSVGYEPQPSLQNLEKNDIEEIKKLRAAPGRFDGDR
ncbi:hypothetical protein QAD02_007375 [Eretmocerus hayati]|uniref:Uncharacterized protein n=1 Tax=Eretmocerus hayati TaxID=131215 RepID=A0ACC2N433_9HYME|nr:hypothetical protein QAD02_007375 [Eretmocerus hayati]